MLNVREYQAQQRAVQEAEQAGEMSPAFASESTQAQRIVEIALRNDVNKIRTLPTLAERAKYKREVFLPKWQGLVDEYFAKGERYQNDVLGYFVVYLFDTGNIEQALATAQKAISDGQSMPEGFQRTFAGFVADSVYGWASTEHSAGRSVEPYFSDTLRNVCTVWKIHEITLAKWLKFTAQLLLRNATGKAHCASIAEPERLLIAGQLCRLAFELNHKSGVLSLNERINMRLNALMELKVKVTLPPAQNQEQNTHQRGEPISGTSQIPFDDIARLLRETPLTLQQVLEKQARENGNV